MLSFLCPSGRPNATPRASLRVSVSRRPRSWATHRLACLAGVLAVLSFGSGCSFWTKPLELHEAIEAPGSLLDLRAGGVWDEARGRRDLKACDPCEKRVFSPPGAAGPIVVHASSDLAARLRPRDIDAGVIYETPNFGDETNTHFQVWIRPDRDKSEELASVAARMVGGRFLVVRDDAVLGLASVPENFEEGVLVAMFNRRAAAVELLEDLKVDHRVHAATEEDRQMARDGYDDWVLTVVRACTCERGDPQVEGVPRARPSSKRCARFLSDVTEAKTDMETERPELLGLISSEDLCVRSGEAE